MFPAGTTAKPSLLTLRMHSFMLFRPRDNRLIPAFFLFPAYEQPWEGAYRNPPKPLFLPICAKEIAKLTATELLPSPLLGLVTPIHFESPPAMENATFVLNDLYASCTLNGEFCEGSNVSPFIAGAQFQALNNKIREKKRAKKQVYTRYFVLFIHIYICSHKLQNYYI